MRRINSVPFAIPDGIRVEDVFTSRARTKILKALSKYGELNIEGISKKVNVNRRSVQTFLGFLVNANMVQKKVFGPRIKIYRLRLESRKVTAIKNLFDTWEEEF